MECKELDKDFKLARGSKIKKIEVVNNYYSHSFKVVFDDMRIKLPGLSNITKEEAESFKGNYLHECKEFLLSTGAYDVT